MYFIIVRLCETFRSLILNLPELGSIHHSDYEGCTPSKLYTTPPFLSFHILRQIIRVSGSSDADPFQYRPCIAILRVSKRVFSTCPRVLNCPIYIELHINATRHAPCNYKKRIRNMFFKLFFSE